MPTWHVYQLRSDTELLYVGYTRNLKDRLGQHRRGKPWWPEVTEVRSEEFTTEDDARRQEKEIWAAESPKYNRLNPFLTPEEKKARKRAEAQRWASAHREQAREACRDWYARNAETRRAQQREYSQRPEVRDRERGRWQALRGVPRRKRGREQDGPGLF